MDIEVRIWATVHHKSGPVIADPDHVRRWVAADGQSYGEDGHIEFEVCPAHPDPDTCHCDMGTGPECAYYRLTINAADW